jgi:hypothetical protein
MFLGHEAGIDRKAAAPADLPDRAGVAIDEPQPSAGRGDPTVYAHGHVALDILDRGHLAIVAARPGGMGVPRGHRHDAGQQSGRDAQLAAPPQETLVEEYVPVASRRTKPQTSRSNRTDSWFIARMRAMTKAVSLALCAVAGAGADSTSARQRTIAFTCFMTIPVWANGDGHRPARVA